MVPYDLYTIAPSLPNAETVLADAHAGAGDAVTEADGADVPEGDFALLKAEEDGDDVGGGVGADAGAHHKGEGGDDGNDGDGDDDAHVWSGGTAFDRVHSHSNGAFGAYNNLTRDGDGDAVDDDDAAAADRERSQDTPAGSRPPSGERRVVPRTPDRRSVTPTSTRSK